LHDVPQAMVAKTGLLTDLDALENELGPTGRSMGPTSENSLPTDNNP
jgi:hypothetical protein